jgi:hypothetical protein
MFSRLVTTFSAVFVFAVSTSASAQVGGWVTASASFAKPASDSATQTAVFPYRAENFEAMHVYTQTSKPSFDLGGGIRFGRFGVGLAASRYSDQQVATSRIVVPNRALFNRPSMASATTQDPLVHSETVLHLEGRYVANLPRVSVALFAGPSMFMISKEVITGDHYTETFNFVTAAQSESITGYDMEPKSVRQWGYNVGADVSYYLSELVGVGGLIRFSHATAKLPNDIQSFQTGVASSTDISVGGLQIGGGLRFRF